MILKALYGLPRKVIFCKKSLISNQRPNSAIEFEHTANSKKKTLFIHYHFYMKWINTIRLCSIILFLANTMNTALHLMGPQ